MLWPLYSATHFIGLAAYSRESVSYGDLQYAHFGPMLLYFLHLQCAHKPNSVDQKSHIVKKFPVFIVPEIRCYVV
jgi:hypothetical protein